MGLEEGPLVVRGGAWSPANDGAAVASSSGAGPWGAAVASSGVGPWGATVASSPGCELERRHDGGGSRSRGNRRARPFAAGEQGYCGLRGRGGRRRGGGWCGRPAGGSRRAPGLL